MAFPSGQYVDVHQPAWTQLVDMETVQPGLQGDPLRFQGIPIRVTGSSAYINSRKFGVRAFDRVSGFEIGKKVGLHFDPEELQKKLSAEAGDRYLTEAPLPHGWART